MNQPIDQWISDHIDDDMRQEWIDALRSLVREEGKQHAKQLLDALDDEARVLGINQTKAPYSAYRNTISLEEQPAYPGDLDIEERLTSIMRWNALAMVVRANKAYGELGGHIASYASCAEIFELGFNHFFRARTESFDGDLVYFQPHSAPGVYARAFLEGRLSEDDLKNYRQEVPGHGLCSYPHPWLMKDFWQVPTGSMGIGPISAIYQARFMRYLEHRQLTESQDRHVWGVFGDGEMDEPESLAALTLAARENLDNLTFIVNCNLQRLDGPVRGNGQIIQELESLFIGAGWNVIKVLWGSEWDTLFSLDHEHVLLKRFSETPDGEYQNLGSKDGDYNRHKFFEKDPKTAALVKHMSDAEINALKRGGHDFKKLFAAFAAAKTHQGQPTVILAKTKKGYGMGGAGESKMTAHQAKKLDIESLLAFRDRFQLPLTDAQVEGLEFVKPPHDSKESQYLLERRQELGGFLPKRFSSTANQLPARPPISVYAKAAIEADGKEMSTTMALVRIISGLLRNKQFGQRLVPIVADEARTFGMQTLFHQIGIYSPHGQTYEPEDAGSLVSYKEAKDGQLLEEGISEAGAISSWTAAATAYSAHNIELLPMYIYYSMFGFQRIGDLIWAAADQRARGFLFGATAGRTTLSGEGLQHQDGSSHLIAATIPTCRAYDPCFAHELAVIVEYGIHRMYDEKHDEFFYVTLMNENYPHPSLPDGIAEDIIRGMYLYDSAGPSEAPRVRLLGSGTILKQVIEAAHSLTENFQVRCEIFSVTSFSELARDAQSVQRDRRLNGSSDVCQVEKLLAGVDPIVCATDYVRAVPSQISPYVEAPLHILGTDGFGRSANRIALREFFEVNATHIAFTAITALIATGQLPDTARQRAQELFEIGPSVSQPAPWNQ
jgi:pyruvate dehydrogenase E1 component